MSKWHPIETAPTDQWILVYEPSNYSPVLAVMLDEDGIWYEGEYGRAIMGVNWMSDIGATHWMPLPEPPEGI